MRAPGLVGASPARPLLNTAGRRRSAAAAPTSLPVLYDGAETDDDASVVAAGAAAVPPVDVPEARTPSPSSVLTWGAVDAWIESVHAADGASSGTAPEPLAAAAADEVASLRAALLAAEENALRAEATVAALLAASDMQAEAKQAQVRCRKEEAGRARPHIAFCFCRVRPRLLLLLALRRLAATQPGWQQPSHGQRQRQLSAPRVA